MARVGKVTTLTLQKIESGASNPTLDTVEGLLRPFGLRLTINRSPPSTARTTER
jgi:DNA-binding phage protein